MEFKKGPFSMAAKAQAQCCCPSMCRLRVTWLERHVQRHCAYLTSHFLHTCVFLPSTCMTSPLCNQSRGAVFVGAQAMKKPACCAFRCVLCRSPSSGLTSSR
eukprot:3251220-Pleurochrysis_carterae.AAC.1